MFRGPQARAPPARLAVWLKKQNRWYPLPPTKTNLPSYYMCWNASVSLQSFALGSLAILLGIQNQLDPTLLFFCATITLMQAIEAIAWSYPYETHPTINTITSRAAALLLWSQPLASIQTLRGTRFSEYRSPLSATYLLLTFLDLILHPTPPSAYRMRPNKGHLEWEWLPSSLLLYFAFLLLPLLLVPNPLLLLFVSLTLGLSLYANHTDNTWGSLWCWQVNGIAIAIVGWKLWTRRGCSAGQKPPSAA